MSLSLSERTPIEQLPGLAETAPVVTLAGWVNSRRDHGGLVFVDLRDHTGLVQLVFSPKTESVFAQAHKLRDEWVIMVRGPLIQRQPDLVNSKIATGQWEIAVDQLLVLNQSPPPPIPVTDLSSANQASEANRLRYRYLDLRRPRQQWFLRRRAELYRLIRGYMEANRFIEVATPVLANSSPEGARDFLVPSRLHQGHFYALPQAPQQFKQLLMIGGLERYYQFAACFRDEDPRSDRLYGDFYQLDMEMSFVDDGADVRGMVEPLIQKMVVDFAGLKLDQGRVQSLDYKTALADYGTDKPDVRFELLLRDYKATLESVAINVLNQPAREPGGALKGLVAPVVLTRSQLDDLVAIAQTEGLGGLASLIQTDPETIKGPLAKMISPAALADLKQVSSWEPGQTLLLAAGPLASVNRTLALIRDRLGDWLNLKDPKTVAAVWVEDFPFYEVDPVTEAIDFSHNPFSRPQGDLKTADPKTVVADQFDLVINGYEVASGAVRNHDPDSVRTGFRTVGYEDSVIEDRFGGLLEALGYGAPPHAGCALGLDRLMMILLETDNIREVVAFPKTGSGVDPLWRSPSPVSAADLAILGIRSVSAQNPGQKEDQSRQKAP